VLGERPAKAPRDQLASLGIGAARITIITYGEERPLCTDHTEACWAQNRWAHFLVKIGARDQLDASPSRDPRHREPPSPGVRPRVADRHRLARSSAGPGDSTEECRFVSGRS
jgi:hypothetical protein